MRLIFFCFFEKIVVPILTSGGYVGLSLGVLLSQHHQVVAVDIVQAKVDMINNKKSPIQDDYIEKYLAEKDLNLTATLDAKAAFEKIDSAVFIGEWLYHYIYNENSISAKHDEANHEYVLKCFRMIKNQVQESHNKTELMKWFDNRLLYVVITTAISGYFSPSNKEPFRCKCDKFRKYLKNDMVDTALRSNNTQTSVYKGYKQDKIEMRGDRAEMSDFPLYLNTVAGGLDRRDQTIGGFSFVVKIYAVPVVEIIG